MHMGLWRSIQCRRFHRIAANPLVAPFQVWRQYPFNAHQNILQNQTEWPFGKTNQHNAGLRHLHFSGVLWTLEIFLSRCEDSTLKTMWWRWRAGLRHLCFSGVLWHVGTCLHSRYEDSSLKANIYKAKGNQCTWTFETLNNEHRLDSKTNQNNAGLRHLHFSGVLWTLENFLSRCEDSTLKTMWWRWRAGLRHLCFSGVLWHVGICLHSRYEDSSLKANIYKAKGNQCTWTFETLNNEHRLDSKTNQNNAGLRHLHLSGVLWTFESFLIGPFQDVKTVHWKRTIPKRRPMCGLYWNFKEKQRFQPNQHGARLRYLCFSGVLGHVGTCLHSRYEDSSLKANIYKAKRDQCTWTFENLDKKHRLQNQSTQCRPAAPPLQRCSLSRSKLPDWSIPYMWRQYTESEQFQNEGPCAVSTETNFKEKQRFQPNQHGARLRYLCFSGVLGHVGTCLHSRYEDSSLKANIYKAKRDQCTWTFENLNKKHRLQNQSTQCRPAAPPLQRCPLNPGKLPDWSIPDVTTVH